MKLLGCAEQKQLPAVNLCNDQYHTREMPLLFWGVHHRPPHGERLKPVLMVTVGKVNAFIFPASEVENMSGIKRVIAEKDPDYEDITVTHPSKRHKAAEQSGRRCGIGNSVDVHAVCKLVRKRLG